MSIKRVLDANNFGLWELSVLSVLLERTMHPYEIQRLLRLRHKDEFLQLKRGSLYHAIHRLEEARLIQEKETRRDGLRPEKTSYAITPTGETAFHGWLKRLLSTPQPETSSFAAAVGFLVYLSPSDALAALETRSQILQQKIEELDQTLVVVGKQIGRIFVIEREYERAITQAEATWILQLVEDLRSKKLKWDIEAILRELRLAASSGSRAKKRPK